MKRNQNNSKSRENAKVVPKASFSVQGIGPFLIPCCIFGVLLFSCVWVGKGCESYLQHSLKFISIMARAFTWWIPLW